MRHVLLLRSTVFLGILIALSGCEDKYASGPAIVWTGGMITYSYNNGVLSGFTGIIKFEVTDDRSGEIQVTASHSGEEKSCLSFVEPGVEYKARVYCSLSRQGEAGSILIDSPSAEEPFTIANSDTKISLGSFTIE